MRRALALGLGLGAGTAGAVADLGQLSLEELASVELTSVSKRAERLAQAPASIYVISAEALQQQGVTSLVQALRLDRELRQPPRPPYIIAGGPDFHSEVARVFELGHCGQPQPELHLSITLSCPQWDGLRSGQRPPNAQVQDMMFGNWRGLEAWAQWQSALRWRLAAGVTALSKDIRLRAGCLDPTGPSALGNDRATHGSCRRPGCSASVSRRRRCCARSRPCAIPPCRVTRHWTCAMPGARAPTLSWPCAARTCSTARTPSSTAARSAPSSDAACSCS